MAIVAWGSSRHDEINSIVFFPSHPPARPTVQATTVTLPVRAAAFFATLQLID
jgi:hypothetical protein